MKHDERVSMKMEGLDTLFYFQFLRVAKVLEVLESLISKMKEIRSPKEGRFRPDITRLSIGILAFDGSPKIKNILLFIMFSYTRPEGRYIEENDFVAKPISPGGSVTFDQVILCTMKISCYNSFHITEY